MSERLYIHHPVSTGKGGYTKKGLHWPPSLGAPPPEGGGVWKRGSKPPPPRGFSIFPEPLITDSSVNVNVYIHTTVPHTSDACLQTLNLDIDIKHFDWHHKTKSGMDSTVRELWVLVARTFRKNGISAGEMQYDAASGVFPCVSSLAHVYAAACGCHTG